MKSQLKTPNLPIDMIVNVRGYWKTLTLPVGLALAVVLAGCSDGASDQRVGELEQTVVALEQTVTALESTPMSTPSSDGMSMQTAVPTLEAMPHDDEVQELAIIENYAATRFFPQWMVVRQGVPVRMYLTRLHREHVNRFSIQPFYESSAVILPGEIGIIEFLPDQIGEFKIRNVGHNFEATLVVVETEEEAQRLIADRGRQMYALIHSVDEFKIFPDSLTVQKDVPVTIHNISLIAEHRVSIEPLYNAAEDLNVRPGEISRFEFTPDIAGEFTIEHELHGFTGRLMVEE